MLSRVANSIYWLSRYTERAENVARFIDVNLQMFLDLPSGSTEQWAPLVSIWRRRVLGELFRGDARQCHRSTFAAKRTRSSPVCAARRCRTIRESISPRCGAGPQLLSDGQRRGLNDLLITLQQRRKSNNFHGITDATLLHGEEWHFIEWGLLERADEPPSLT
jgi:uncharacterized alpha-E superfamily protein